MKSTRPMSSPSLSVWMRRFHLALIVVWVVAGVKLVAAEVSSDTSGGTVEYSLSPGR